MRNTVAAPGGPGRSRTNRLPRPGSTTMRPPGRSGVTINLIVPGHRTTAAHLGPPRAEAAMAGPAWGERRLPPCSADRLEQHQRDLPAGLRLVAGVVLVVGDDERPQAGPF